MSSQQRVQKTHSERTTDVEETPSPPQENPEAAALKQHSDELLDEIDSVLEDNAAEFIQGYIQKGGE